MPAARSHPPAGGQDALSPMVQCHAHKDSLPHPATGGERARLETQKSGRYAWSFAVIDYRDYITIEPGKRGGKPCVRGLRITVYDVLSYLASGMTVEEVLVDFPSLTREDVLACLAYAADREQQTLTVIP
jgi:uncharacterized protein (DUF433 family)